MLKKQLGIKVFKKLRSVASVLLAICMTAVMFAGITVPVQADTSSVGKMLEVYNQQPAWSDQQLEQQIANLPAGKYVLSANYMHEGNWIMQAQTWDNPNPTNPNNLWRQVPGWTWIESENEYLTTINFETTAALNFRVRFIAPKSTSKLWIANVTLCREGETENLLTNGDFSNGTSGWSFTNPASAFPNATVKDIEDGFFDKPTEIAPPSGNMLEVYKTSTYAGGAWIGQTISNLPAGTYEFSAYFKNEGRWLIQAQTLDNGEGWAQTAEKTFTESEDFYYTTIRFTKTGNTNCRVRFVAPTDASNTSKLWIANASLRHISGGSWWGRCTNYLTNGDFSNGTTGWGLYRADNSSGVNDFSTPVVREIEDGFFDKPTEIAPPSGNMLEVYKANNYSTQTIGIQSTKKLTPGTYEFSAYFKHEGGWTMQAQENNSGWKTLSSTVTESENEYYTTIRFTLSNDRNFRALFTAPDGTNTSKLWIANISVRHITGGSYLGTCINYINNGDFTVGSDGLTNWTLSNQDSSFPNATTKVIENGFFDKPTGTESPSGKMLTFNKAAGDVNLGLQQQISVPAGTYAFSSYFKHRGDWTLNIETYQTNAWKPIPGAVSVTPEGMHFKRITFTLDKTTTIRIRVTAPEDGGTVWIANVKLHRTDGSDNGNIYVKNGNFLDSTNGWAFIDNEDANKITNVNTLGIPEDLFLITLSNHELFDCITEILCKKATQADYPDSDFDKNGTTDIVDLLLVEQRMIAGASAEADAKRTDIINSESGIENTAEVLYVSENGNDSTGDGSQANPYKTVAKANTVQKNNVTILLERGGTYRLTETVELKHGFKYGAYGTGAKPVVSGSPQDFADASWTQHSENIWQVSYPYSDAGIVVFNNGENWGCKKFGDGAMEQLQKDGDYYHDVNGEVLYLYSSDNPAEKYSSIEIGCNIVLFKVQGNSLGNTNIYIDNISFKYTGAFGVRAQKADGLYITNCEFGWIGGSIQSGNTRYGNGIELWEGQKNVTVENNWFYQIYDSGFTFQGIEEDTKTYRNIFCNENLFENVNTAFEFWHNVDGFTFENIQFNGNISRLVGYGQCDQGENKWVPGHIYLNQKVATGNVTDFTIQNNIFDTSREYIASVWFNTDDSISSDVWDVYGISQNTYYQKKTANGLAIYIDGAIYAANQAELEAAITLFDANPKMVVMTGFDS